MDEYDYEYNARELDRLEVDPDTDDTVRLQLRSNRAETRWLSVDMHTYRRLVNVLTSGNN